MDKTATTPETLIDAVGYLADPDVCLNFLAELRWPAGVACPTSGSVEVLLSANRVNAELFRMEKKIGTVEPGKYADLIAVKGNPLRDLRVL